MELNAEDEKKRLENKNEDSSEGKDNSNDTKKEEKPAKNNKDLIEEILSDWNINKGDNKSESDNADEDAGTPPDFNHPE